METAILSGIIKQIVTSLGTAALIEITKLVCVRREINNLSVTFGNINSQIRDAEQIVAHSEATNYRLKQLRDYAYEAENIIDLFNIQLGTPQESRPQGWRCREVGIRCKAVSDIQELNNKLERITPILLHVAPREDQTGQNIYVGPQHDESNIAGRNIANECSNLLGILGEGNQGDQCLSFAIVGAAGVGKTTLARKIYHNSRNTFRTRLWVHVSDDSGELAVWQEDNSLGRRETRVQREALRRILTNNARYNKLLLVIDNVWKEDGWNQFLEQNFCRRGNTLLVTTRHEEPTRIMGITRYHRVERLSEDDGWMLLRKMANLREADATEGFEDVGRRIVQKCSGLPVAIRRIGYDLRGRNRQGDWEEVYACDLFDRYPEIHNSIDKSYKMLSYLVKRCFLYCSLYPEGSVIEKQCIMQQWIAEGFFFSDETSQEDQAEHVYQELIRRCLLLPEDKAQGESGVKMPNLLRLFAIYQSQDENFVSNPRDISTRFKPWRLSVTNGGRVEDIPDEATSLKSLFLFASQMMSVRALSVIFNKLTSLRVLDLRDTQVETISSNLERLRQLRYLNLSGTRIQSLPASIGNLTVLQFLILKNCPILKSLPSCVGRLKKLRSLDISGTPMLDGVKFKLLQLTQLNCLQGFIPTISASEKNVNGWKFEELRPLCNLRSLQMINLDRALSSGDDINQLNLHQKTNLKELELWCSSADQNRDRNAEQDVFEELRPAECLVSLKIVNYYGNQFPSWLSSSHLTLLQRLTLDDCLPSLDLPALGQMMNLKFLAITASNIIPEGNINQLHREPRDRVAFPLLEQLVLGRMESLEPWSILQETDLPLLRGFHLGGCRQGLVSIPPWLQSCRELTSMKIQHADTLQEIANFPSVKELEVQNCSRLQTVSNMDRLEDLKISNCADLEAVNGVPFLCSVHIKLQTAQLPWWLQHQQSFKLRRLEITGTEELLNRCSSPFAPCWPIIQDVADHVCGKKLGDDSIYFSYNKSTGSLYTSQRRSERITVDRLPTSTMPPDNWKAWMLNVLYAILMIASCSLFYLANF